MSRTLVASHRTSIEEQFGEDQPLVFLEITHADLATPIRVVNDTATASGVPVTYTYNGNTFTAFPFLIRVLSDDGGPPRGEIEIGNVDRQLSETVLALKTAVSMQIWIFATSEFDLTVNPRVPIGTPTAIWQASSLLLRDISIDVLTMRATIESLDDTSELWPGLTATKTMLPGLYR